MDKIYKTILGGIVDGKIDKYTGAQLIGMLQKTEPDHPHDIAIVGMALNMPSAMNTESFWENILEKLDCIRQLPKSRVGLVDQYLKDMKGQAKCQYKQGGFLEDVDTFDYEVFRLLPKEARLMDPCQRLFLQTAWHALEDAGFCGNAVRGSKTGVFVGYAESGNYKNMLIDTQPENYSIGMVGNIAAMLPSRLSYLLDLKGPSMVVDTACSSSMIGVYLACQSLMAGDCDTAVAAGVKLDIFPLEDDNTRIGIESTDSRTNTFSNEANGAALGEGVAALVLKPLDKAMHDNDHVYGIIKSCAVNQDGASMGITAPSAQAQADVIVDAWNKAGIDPTTLAFIEAHGTGTKLGDPIELQGLKKAFEKYTDKKQFCAIGSVKTNIGHLYECSGMASILKCVLALNNRIIPPTSNFRYPNREINFSDSALYVNTKAREWNGEGPMRCAISSFGLSGTNCHLVLEEPPVSMNDTKEDDEWNLFTVSAYSEDRLEALLKEYLEFFATQSSLRLSDLCFTANTGREVFACRITICTNSLKDLTGKIETLLKKDFHEYQAEWYCYGQDRGKQQNVASGRRLSEMQYAKDKVQRGGSSEKGRFEELKNLGNLFAIGAPVNWDEFYYNKNVKRIRMPGYIFQQSKCWLDYGDKSVLTSGLEEQFFYEQRFLEQNKELSPSFSLRDRKILYIFSGIERDSISEQLIQTGHSIIELHIRIGADYSFSEKKVVIDGSEEQYNNAISGLSKTGIDCVIFSYACKAGEGEKRKDFEQSYHNGTLGLFYFIKALQKANWTQVLNVFVLARNIFLFGESETSSDPQGASLFGLGKIVQKEISYLICRCIEYDDRTSPNTIISQIESDDTELIVSYRGEKRYAQQFCPLRGKKAEVKKDVIRSNGVYLITGGLGGIGIEISKYIASQKKIRIILINRTILPEREEWKQILEKDSADNLAKKINSLLELEEMGAQVTYYSGDVSNYERMKWIVEDIISKFGEINGIIHAAGIGKSDFLINRTVKEFKELYEPKVKGAWNLDVLTRSLPFDFFVLFSSVATFFPAIAQGDYVAANSYLDALSAKRRREGRPFITINWTTWKETGMALESDYKMDTIFRLLSTKDAITGFEAVLHQPFTNVLIGHLNGTTVGASLLQNAKVWLSEELESLVSKFVRKKESVYSAEREKTQKCKPQSMNQLEDKLVDICQKILGLEWIDPGESFFEMGADSIFLFKIFQEVDKLYPGVLTITQLFEYATVERLADYLTEHTKGEQKEYRQILHQESNDNGRQIAVIGMALRVPNADTMEQFWENSIVGMDCIRKIPNERKEELSPYLNYMGICNERFRENGYLDNISSFDPLHFKLSARDAMLMDPHQRMFLKTAWEAIEGAGYGGNRLSGTKTGVYLGYASTLRDIYSKMLNDIAITEEAFLDNLVTMMPGRLSYLLNLKGPSLVLDTACSSSLVAVEMASQAIRSGTIDYAVAAGIKLNLLPLDSEDMKIGIEAGSGRSLAFSNGADGSAIGEGVGAVLLKRLDRALEDGDNILAVIKGAATNQDGCTAGITVPNPSAQSQVIEDALFDADINVESISYIEAHGTGTSLGDPIEIQGISNALERFTAKKQFCAVSSVKTLIGHSSEAAGILSFIRAVLALNHKQMPASLNFTMPNAAIDFSNTSVYINTKTRPWIRGEFPRRCGVSAFGISGTNCHIVLEEAPIKKQKQHNKGPFLFTVSARNRQSLHRLIGLYASFVEQKELDLLSFCYTAETGRDHFSFRLAFVFTTREELLERLNRLVHSDFIDCSSVYYGERKVVNNNKPVIEENEITLNFQKKITKEAEELLNITWQGKEEQLKELARLYIEGADIPWEQLYQGQKIDKIYLPTYCLEEKKYWFECPVEKKSNFLQEREEGFYHTVTYKPIAVEPHAVQAAPGAILLLAKPGQKSSNMIAALKRHGAEVYCPECDGSENSFTEMLNLYSGKQITQIVHMLTLEEPMEVNGVEQLEASLESGVYSVLNLVKALECGKFNGNVRLNFITAYAYDPANGQDQYRPENAALLALGKVIPQECSQLRCHAVDTDFETDEDILTRELLTEHQHYLTLFRKGKEYREEFQEVDLRQIPNDKVSIKSDGVYIITGGLGGIGLTLSQHLAKQNAGHIVAFGRSELPPRTKWESILRGEDTRLKDVIRAIKKVEESGTTLEYYCVDVTKEEEVRFAIRKLTKCYGRINGIIHGAGIAGDGFLVLKSRDKFKATLMPKIYGTYILEQQTRDLDMDFFVLFSSNDTLFGKAGQGDYTAANSYLDAMTFAMNQRGRKTIAINWVAWNETGMAKEHSSFQENDMFDTLTNQQGIHGFMQALNKKIPRIIIGRMNYSSPILNEIEKSPISISPKLCTVIQNVREEVGFTECIRSNNVEYGEVQLAGNKDGAYTETQKELARIWGHHLGMEQVNIYDDFYEYGGDSILALKISHDIATYMGKTISVVNILQCPSVERLAPFLEEISTGGVIIEKGEKLSCYPLSPAQYRLFIVHQFDKTKISNNISHAFQMHGELQVEWLQEALNQLINRHDILRTSFEMRDGTPVQVIHDSIDFAIEMLGDVEGDVLHAIESWMKPFDLEKAPLMRFGVWKIDKDNWLLAFAFHHMITDGTSMDIFMRDLTSLYNRSKMEPLTYQYCDYTQWLMKRLAAQELNSHAIFWKKVMHKPIPEIVLISDRERPLVKTFRGGIVEQKLDNSITGSIFQHCVQKSITHYVFLLSCYYVLLYKYSAQNDIIVGTPVSGREQNEFKNTMGVFINTLALRCEINPEMNFMDLLHRVKDITLEAFAHQEYPFNFLVSDLQLKSTLQRNPLFDVYFALQNVGNYKGEVKVLNGDEIFYERGIARFDLSLDIYEEGTEFRLALEYSSDLFQRETAERILQDYVGIVQSVVRENRVVIREISLVSLGNRCSPKQKEETFKDDILFQF